MYYYYIRNGKGRKRKNYKGDLCTLCHTNTVCQTSKYYWSNKCDSCRQKPYRRFRKKICENCGFIPIHNCQLDVDHIDGNRLDF